VKTIKQIAAELSMSKQAVRNQIVKLGLQSRLRKNGNSFVIDETQEKLIKCGLSRKIAKKRQTEPQTTLQSDLQFALRLLETQNEQLSAELTIKNRQIETLTTALENTTASLNAAQALHAGTIQKQLTESSTDPEKKQEPKGFFSQLFKNKTN
jgi:hypothetical protein